MSTTGGLESDMESSRRCGCAGWPPPRQGRRWCGARKGRRATRIWPVATKQTVLWSLVVSMASSSVSGERMAARRFAGNDSPVPGGPMTMLVLSADPALAASSTGCASMPLTAAEQTLANIVGFLHQSGLKRNWVFWHHDPANPAIPQVISYMSAAGHQLAGLCSHPSPTPMFSEVVLALIDTVFPFK